MFDEDLFMYYDDVDYSWKLRLLEYDVKCIKHAYAYHLGSATLGADSPLFWYYLSRNSIWVSARNSSISWFIIRLIFYFIELLANIIGRRILIWNDSSRVRAVIKGVFDGIKGLKKAFAKRRYINQFRRVSDFKVNKYMNKLADVYNIIPKSIRHKIICRTDIS